MIRSNELRIGNRVMYNNRMAKVISLHKAGQVYLNIEGYVYIKNIYPVKLNKDLLLRYGFTEEPDGIFKYKYRKLTEVFCTFNEFFFRYDGKFIASCKFLHDLQNIYFALYKEEIKTVRSAMLVI
jgi:hypothetical protein